MERQHRLIRLIVILGALVGTLRAAEGILPFEHSGAGTVERRGGICHLQGGDQAHQPVFLLRPLEEGAQQAVAITVRTRHTGGRHRSLHAALGSSESGSILIGGPWTGLGRTGLAQYTAPVHPPVDQHLPPATHPLPEIGQWFTITLAVDLAAGQVTTVVEGCQAESRPLQVPLPAVDRVGFCVRGETGGAFELVSVATGTEAVAATIAAAAAAAGKWSDERAAVPEDAPPCGVILAEAYAAASDVASVAWVDNVYGHATQRLTIADSADGRALAVEVPSKVDVFLRDELQLRPGLVYRVELTARCVGQIEQIEARMDSRRFQPVTWPLHREWTRYLVQIRSRGGAFRFGIRLQGVGSFQIRDLRVSEVADFDLPVVDTPPRGELLRNGDFALGHLDWTLRFPARERSPLAPPMAWLAEALVETGGAGLSLAAGKKALLTSGSELFCHYGRRYRITVHGEAAPGDLEAFLVRPGMAAVDNERFALEFVAGQAVVEYPLTLPQEGMLAEPVQQFALRLRHNGESPARITRVELREGEPDAAVASASRIGVEIADPACVVLGETVTARVHVAGLEAAAPLVLVVVDEHGREVAREAVLRDPSVPGPIEVAVHDLPPGWFRVSAESPGQDLQVVPHDLAVLLPSDPAMRRSGFLGVHLGRLSDARQVELLSDLGVRHVRVWECAWNRVQPAREAAFELPTELIDGYVAAGLDPLLVLGYPPDWASSAPASARKTWNEAQKYPPRDIADWEAYVRAVARELGERVRFYEIWNEPNGHYLKPAPGDERPLEQVYAELVAVAYRAIHEEDPDAVVVIGACAGHPSFAVRSMHQHGAAAHCEALSYHAYGGANEAGMGTAAFAYTQDHLAQWLPQVGRPDLPVFDTESGIKDLPDGPQGDYVSMVLAQGLVARQAAGFDRYYLYNAEPRQYPGHRNFQMLFGFDAQPLVALPMVAAWDRLLGDARYRGDIGDADQGLIAYRFERADGMPVIAAWSNGGAGRLVLPGDLADAAVIDALGRRLDPPREDGLILGGGLCYVVPSSLLPALGIVD